MKIFLTYLIEVSVCQAILFVLYRLIFSKFTFFQFNRFFLIGMVLVSFIIPVLQFQVYDSPSIANQPVFKFWQIADTEQTATLLSSSPSGNTINWMNFVIKVGLGGYLAGLFYFAFRFVKGIFKITKIVRENPSTIENGYKVVQTHSGPPFYSFLQHIFINNNSKGLFPEEIEIALKHEQLHVDLKHSYDLLFVELARIVCWFNPVIHWIKKAVIENHEYEVDQLIDGKGRELYTGLILKLSMNGNVIPIASQFSMKSMKKRIHKIYQLNTNTMKKLYYLLTIPAIGMLAVLFSFTAKAPGTLSSTDENTAQGELIIDEVTWKGNTLYSDDYLTGFMKIKQGEVYDEAKIQEEIAYKPDGSDIGSLYMDKGYLFFYIEVLEQEKEDNKVDLTFTLNEGEVFHVNEIDFEGFPKNVDYSEIIPLKSNDIFKRSLLIKSQQILFEKIGKEIIITPIPIAEENKVNIAFEVKEKNKSSN